MLRSVVILALFLTGCAVPQAHPIHMPDEVVFEPTLIGKWETTIEGTLKLTFDVSRWSQDDNSYRCIVTAEHQRAPVCEFRMYFSRIDGTHYLTVGNEPKVSADNEPDVLRYNTIVVDEWQPKLHVRVMDLQWLFRAIGADPTIIKHRGTAKKDFLVTATTRELRAFHQKHLKEDGPWKKFILGKKN